MARKVATLFLLFVYGSCMEMRETVERMVMVRTTGSDLQPAATGYLYKKESDGPASVTKMAASEVFEHFSKLYGKPEASSQKATPTGAESYANGDRDKSATHATEEAVKPVVEALNDDDQIDGLASEEYDKIFENYARRFRNSGSDYEHYPFKGHTGIYADADYDVTKTYDYYAEKGQLGYGVNREMEKGGAGHYDTEKIRGLSVARPEWNYKNRENYGHERDYKADYKNLDGFQKHFKKDTIEDDCTTCKKFFKKGEFESPTIDRDDRKQSDGEYQSKEHDESHTTVGHISEEPSGGSYTTHSGKSDNHAGKSYNFEIKH